MSSQGEEKETRQKSANNAIELFDDRLVGFWITVSKNDGVMELALGKIGQPLVDPIMVWEDTDRRGPSDVSVVDHWRDIMESVFEKYDFATKIGFLLWIDN